MSLSEKEKRDVVGRIAKLKKKKREKPETNHTEIFGRNTAERKLQTQVSSYSS